MNKVYLGLGTNMGDRFNYLDSACELIQNNSKIKVLKNLRYMKQRLGDILTKQIF